MINLGKYQIGKKGKPRDDKANQVINFESPIASMEVYSAGMFGRVIK